MATISEEAIRERAYKIWEREGRPHGCDFEHWVRAQVELLAESSGNGGRNAAPQRARVGAKAAPASNGKSAAAAGVKAAAAKAAAAKASRPAARAGRSAKKPA